MNRVTTAVYVHLKWLIPVWSTLVRSLLCYFTPHLTLLDPIYYTIKYNCLIVATILLFCLWSKLRSPPPPSQRVHYWNWSSYLKRQEKKNNFIRNRLIELIFGRNGESFDYLTTNLWLLKDISLHISNLPRSPATSAEEYKTPCNQSK